MDSKKHKCVLISDFNISNFSNSINNNNDYPLIDSFVAPYGQVVQVIGNKDFECWENNPDFAFIWTIPESCIKTFNEILYFKNISLGKILNEVDEYSDNIMKVLNRVKFAFVATWVAHSCERGHGILDMKNNIGISNTLMRINLRLAENLEKASSIHLLDTQKWITFAGKKAFNPKLWYMGKIAFGNEVFINAVKDLKAALKGIEGLSKKLIILDLDNTLWGGVVGDIGWQNIVLGGHDHVGEAYKDFQRVLKSMVNKGILLGIVSKNEEATALEAIKKHQEMVLNINDFSGWQINWQDKAQNIVDLVSDLNLGLQSVVFIDDNPVERARVKDAIPEIFVPEWPADPTQYRTTLLSLDCFDTPSISKEDLARSKMYSSEKKRKELKRKVGSLDEWLRNLGVKVKIEKLNQVNLGRAAQLLNKTNQMNLKTRRMTESEFADWAKKDNHKVWTFRVSDKFGDAGLTGIASLDLGPKTANVTDFILSCRVMGRGIEESMIHKLIKYSKSNELKELVAEYTPTSKNKPCLTFWQNSEFEFDEKENKFCWDLKKDYIFSKHIEIIEEN